MNLIGEKEQTDSRFQTYGLEMNQYMVPNSKEMGINGIYRVVIKGQYTSRDFDMIIKIFGERAQVDKNSVQVKLSENQWIEFISETVYQIELFTNSNTGRFIEIENVKIYC